MWSELTSGIFGRGALSFLLATAGVSVSNFAFHVVVSRVIGPDQYGALGAILGVNSGQIRVELYRARIQLRRAVRVREDE